jgi:LysM domain/Family of unknown function (DUF5715)
MNVFQRICPRPTRFLAALLPGLALLAATPSSHAQSLRGSRASMDKQNEEAAAHDFTYLQTADEVRDFVDRGLLVRVAGDDDYEVADVSFPFARPEVKTFLDRLAHQYRSACGEQLVVTSLTRPADHQPWNASPLSVHPTGMAADLRRSNRRSCRNWIERNLLALERDDVLEATKERHPPHYHVSLFPKPYLRYLARRGIGPDGNPETRIAKAGEKASRQPRAARASSAGKKVRVSPGDTLWAIAQRHGVSVAAVKRANGIHSNHLEPGQILSIPSR